LSQSALDVTALIITGAAWLLALLSLLGVKLSKRGRRLPGYRWTSTGVLLLMTCQVVTIVASYENWPHPQRRIIEGGGVLLDLLAMGFIIKGMVAFRRAKVRTADTGNPSPGTR